MQQIFLQSYFLKQKRLSFFYYIGAIPHYMEDAFIFKCCNFSSQQQKRRKECSCCIIGSRYSQLLSQNSQSKIGYDQPPSPELRSLRYILYWEYNCVFKSNEIRDQFQFSFVENVVSVTNVLKFCAISRVRHKASLPSALSPRPDYVKILTPSR